MPKIEKPNTKVEVSKEIKLQIACRCGALLYERSDNPGRHFCSKCFMHVDSCGCKL